MSDVIKTALLAGLFMMVGSSMGVGLTVALLRRKRKERAFTREDTTALAFQIAKLSSQLGEERERNLELIKMREVVEQPAEVTQESGEKADAVSVEHGSGAASPDAVTDDAPVQAEPTSSKASKTSGGDDLDDMLATYRQQYQNWRRGSNQGSNKTERALSGKGMTRHHRSYTHGDADDLADASPYIDRMATWQQLNMGPSAKQKPIKIAVIGGGAFGTAMAAAAGRNGHEVVILVRRREMAREIKLTNRNEAYLPGLTLPRTVTATVEPAEALKDVQLVIHALPAQKSPEWIEKHRDLIPPNVIYCSTSKGLYLKDKCLLSEAMMRAFGRAQPFAILSGPSFAKEIVSEQPTSVVVASKKLADAVMVQRTMSSETFRVYASQDTVGVELGGALKNPLALGAGMIEGLGFGINTMSAYITRSAAELTSLSVAMGGKPETIAGLAGIGDLALTAFGSLSRNRTCGMRLVQGEKLEDILAKTTVEGVPTAKVAVDFAEMCNLHLPIFQTVNNILTGKLQPEEFVHISMMQRPLTMETHTGALSEVLAQKPPSPTPSDE